MTAIILHFHGHQRVRCDGTSDRCAGGYCMTCELYTCSRCGGAEGTLPRDCPGERMSEDAQRDVYEGRLDFRWREGWVVLQPRRERA
jgi:hypothetical protein